MAYLLDENIVGFPDPELADPDGLVAVGGGMSVTWLYNAYHYGLFPWYRYKGKPYWFSPDPRMVLFPKEFRCSKSLARKIHSPRFETRIDTCFREVVECCASVKRKEEGTWIDSEFVDAYCRLHDVGVAHSFETFLDGKLVGGLYGVGIADYFCGESMFHTVSDASKIAFARMVEFALMHRTRFIDAQMYTDHLASLGAREIPRHEFLQLLENKNIDRSYFGRWRNNSVVLLLGGNQGDRISLLLKAVGQISRRIGTVFAKSPIFETEPWGFESEQSFLNMAVAVDTDLKPMEVLRIALDIEKKLGRVRPDETQDNKDPQPKERHYSSRPIDIDLIFYNSQVMDTPELQIPHPRMQDRRFVLEPLRHIIPDFIHPKLHKTIEELAEECSDKGDVKWYF